MWSNRGIRQKVFILSFFIAFLPLLVACAIWSRAAHDQLKQGTKDDQKVILNNSARKLDDFLDAQIEKAVAQSKDTSVASGNIDQAKTTLIQYSKHDNNIMRIALVGKDGSEKVVISDRTLSKTLGNVASSEPFKAITQSHKDVSISEVTYDNELPKIVVAVPVTNVNAVSNQNNEVLIVDISLVDIWTTVLSADLSAEGYSYIVDSKGKVIAYPDLNTAKSSADFSSVDEVSRFLKRPAVNVLPITTVSERNVKVISAHQVIPRTGWAIITEQPEEVIFAPLQHVFRLILVIFVLATLFAVLLDLLFSRNFTRPIHSLVAGTAQLGQGNLDTRIPIRSKDEIGLLTERFNTMAVNLKRLVSNLQTESNKLSIVLDSVGEGIIAIDSQNRIVFANISAAVLAGTLPSNLSGKSFNDVFTLSKNNKPFELDPNSTKVYKEIVFVSPNKRLHYLDIFANRIEDDPDDIKSIITLRDQTDERDLEMMKLDFVSMAAHELRTPITAIRGYLGLLSGDDESSLSDSSKQSVERAQSSTNQLVGLINNLLNVSKIEGGSLDLGYEKVDWGKMVQESVDDQQFSADEKHITLEYNRPDEDIALLADKIAIKEVINNLIANAINYTEPDGHVTVGIKTDGHHVITSVKDDGIGIAPNALQRLFTKFYRAKGVLASGSGGTGLGLYISKSIVELHKGKIWVESQEGEGSTFTFSLPAFDEVQYKELQHKQKTGIHKRHGWATKDTTR
jgi:signal transduction histidine kinase